MRAEINKTRSKKYIKQGEKKTKQRGTSASVHDDITRIQYPLAVNQKTGRKTYMNNHFPISDLGQQAA